MKKLLFLLLIGMVARGQSPARVTIYTPGGAMRGSGRATATLGVGEHETFSNGQVFDGDTMLASMYAGRFVSFDLTPGNHLIGTAQIGSDARSEVSIHAVPGGTYFVRLTATSKGFWAIQRFRSHLEIVSCEDARKEADTTKPLQVKMIRKEGREHLVDGTYFPRCPPESVQAK